MRSLLSLAIFAVSLTWADAASAKRVEVDGVTLDLPMPQDFCARPVVPGDPRNADLVRNQPPAAAPIIMAEPCGAPMPQPGPRLTYGRWLLMLDDGAPRRLAPRSSRDEALRRSVEGKPVLTTGMVFQMGFLSPNLTSGIIGRDGIAVYRAVVYPVSSPAGGSLIQAGIEGETVLRGRAVAFQLFDTYRDDVTFTPLERDVKALMGEAIKQDPSGNAPPRSDAPKTVTPHHAPRLELMEAVWLLARAVGIAALVFAVSAWVFRRRTGQDADP